MWARVGGYHFDYKDTSKSINGIQANVEFTLNNNLSLILQDNYDNQNDNRFSAGLRLRLGGSTAPKNTIQGRMMDPIIRHQARQSYGEALPSRDNYVANGPQFNAFDNVWFFSPNGSKSRMLQTMNAQQTPIDLSSCTAENPCGTLDTFTTEGIAAIAPNANMFFETGTYAIPTNPENGYDWVRMYDGQSVYGREKGWLQPAFGDNRPLISGALFWGSYNGGPYDPAKADIANGQVRNLRINSAGDAILTLDPFFNPNDPVDTVLALGGTGDLRIYDSSLSAESNEDVSDKVLALSGFGNVIVEHTDFDAFNFNSSSGIRADAGDVSLNYSNMHISADTQASIGVFAARNIDIYNSNINTHSNNLINGSTNAVWGFGNTQTIKIVNSNINASADGERTVSGVALFNFSSPEPRSIIIDGSTINVTNNGNPQEGINDNAIGVLGFSLASPSNILVNNSTINATNNGSSNTNTAQANAINNFQGDIVINNSTLTASKNSNLTSDNSLISGIQVGGPGGNVSLNNSTIKINGPSSSDLEPVFNESDLTVNQSRCFKNGSKVDC
jgi:hypothetical protein